MYELLLIFASVKRSLQNIWLQISSSILLFFFLFWKLETLIPISDASYCFMDAVLWSDALDAFHSGNINLAAKMDRPPLSLVLGTVLKNFGYTTPQALQLIAKISFAGSVGCLFGGMWRFHSLPIACLSAYLLLHAPSYVKLSLWLNAQMFCNFVFVLHLVFGWMFIQKEKTWSWILLGAIASAGTLAKEQGLLLYPLTFMFCFGYSRSIKQSLRQGFYFFIGSLPLGIWHFHWLRAQKNYGEKWKLFDTDLKLLLTQDSWQEFLTIKTSWGSFANRFYPEQDVLLFFSKTASLLMRELFTLSSVSISLSSALFLLCIFWKNLGKKPLFFWYLCHLLPIILLVIIPIFEPYHYSTIAIGSIALLAWGLHVLWKLHPMISLATMYWGFQSHPIWGTAPEQTLKDETRSCIETRILPVREWAKKNVERGANLYFTDSLLPWAKGYYPQTVEVLRSTAQMETMNCHTDYIAVSEISNHKQYFKQYFDNHPPNWTIISHINSVNKEIWWIYQPPCASLDIKD